jgi:hypothetical protein
MWSMTRERKSKKTVDEKLDEALEESFPASDPVSIGRNDHPGEPKEPPPKKKKPADKK